MSKLNRRALLGTAGLLATAPFLPKDVGAVEQPAALVPYVPDADLRAMRLAEALCASPTEVSEIPAHWWEAAQQLAPSAPEQYPPEGYTFCDGSEGERWGDRFGADASAHREEERGRYDVRFNGEKHLWVFAAKAGPNGWIAEGVMREYRDEYGTAPVVTPCNCADRHVLLRITYGDVQLVDHWA